jgi:NAD(P)-dependent dehydrogenase (short-subunit alcohol dehydrogenase family)
MLAGRNALVLGIDDIGAGIAHRFAREGATVALLDPDEPAGARLVAGDSPGAIAPADDPVSGCEAGTVAKLVGDSIRTLGRLDVLVCNLLPPPRPLELERVDDPALEQSFERVRATVAAMRAALPALRASGHGRILLVGHRYGETVSEAIGAYNLAAWSLVGLARTAAVEWGQYQIATNVLLPLAETEEFHAARARRPAVVDLLVSQLPLRRVGHPVEDIGGAATFIASDAACFVNGQVVYADGGQHVAGPVLNPARFV